MLYAVPFRAEHVFNMRLQPAQQEVVDKLTLEGLRSLETTHAHTLMEDGAPVACCGAAEIWEGRAYIWAFLSDKVETRNFREVFSWAKLFVSGLPFRRLEAAVVSGFENGERMMRCLGFKCFDRKAEAFTPDGADASLWVQVKTCKL